MVAESIFETTLVSEKPNSYKMIRRLNNPVVAILTALMSFIAVLENLIGFFYFAPFWADMVLSFSLGSLLVYWILQIMKRKSEDITNALLLDAAGQPISYRLKGIARKLPKGWSFLIPILILTALFLWRSYQPVNHILRSKWEFSGHIETKCGPPDCILLFDRKNRKILSGCRPTDDSGYIYVIQDNWYTYQPVLLSTNCSESGGSPVKIPGVMFKGTSTAKMVVP